MSCEVLATAKIGDAKLVFFQLGSYVHGDEAVLQYVGPVNRFQIWRNGHQLYRLDSFLKAQQVYLLQIKLERMQVKNANLG